jgi:hypothetical protein
VHLAQLDRGAANECRWFRQKSISSGGVTLVPIFGLEIYEERSIVVARMLGVEVARAEDGPVYTHSGGRLNGNRLAIALVRSGVDVEAMKPVVYRGMVGNVFGLIWGIYRRVRLTDYAECKLGIQPRVRAETRGHTAENTLPPFALLSAVDGIGRSHDTRCKDQPNCALAERGPAAQLRRRSPSAPCNAPRHPAWITRSCERSLVPCGGRRAIFSPTSTHVNPHL